MVFAMLKRDVRLFLRCLIPALLLTALFALVCAGAAVTAARSAEDVLTPVRVAVVDGEDSLFSRMAVSAVQEMEHLRETVSLERMHREDAEAGLADGTLAAVILLPDGFVEDITRGRSGKGQILLSAAAASQSQVVETAARCGELLLAAGQYGVFSGEALVRERAPEACSDFLRQANLALLNGAATAHSAYFTVVETGYANTSMTTSAYYGAGWITLLLFLCAIFFTHLSCRDLNRPMLCRLKAAGVGDGAFLTGKLALPILFRWALLLPALFLLPLAANRSAGAVLSALLAAAAAGIMGAAVSMGLRSGIAVNGVAAVAGLFLCGGIVPVRLLPEALITVGGLTPFGAVLALIRPVFGGQVSLTGWALTLLYTAVALLWISRRLHRIRGGGDSL